MKAVTVANDAGAGNAARADKSPNLDFSFLPNTLVLQCQNLIKRYHELHGYACLPDILWKARLGPFIEINRAFSQLLKKASRTRSAKKSNEGFVLIAATILSLEVLASSFVGWSAIYPEAGSIAHAILKRNGRSLHLPLMEFYLQPPTYISSAALATLAPPASREPSEAEFVSRFESRTVRRKTRAHLHQCDGADLVWTATASRCSITHPESQPIETSRRSFRS
jgi:hypothetical protein